MHSYISRLEDNYTQIPNELYLITDSTYEDCLLFHLIKHQRKNNSCFVSIKTLCKYLHTTNHNTIEKVIKALKIKGYIDYIKGNAEQNKSNEYSVNMDKILLDIHSKLSNKDLIKRAEKELSESQKDAISAKRVAKNRSLLLKVNTAQGLKTIDEKTGEILN